MSFRDELQSAMRNSWHNSDSFNSQSSANISDKSTVFQKQKHIQALKDTSLLLQYIQVPKYTDNNQIIQIHMNLILLKLQSVTRISA